MNSKYLWLLIMLSISLLNGCMSREEAAKHVTISLIQSPEASLEEWHAVTSTSSEIQRFESPLGHIQIKQTPTTLTDISQVQAIFTALKQHTEQEFSDTKNSLITPADDDLLKLANHDFLHSTFRVRNRNNERQRIELFVAPINKQLITIIVQIGDDADIQSYSDLQTFLNQQVTIVPYDKTLDNQTFTRAAGI